jgi:hypothetical protein
MINETSEKNLLAKARYYLSLAARADKGEIGFRESDPALDMGYHGYLLAKLVEDLLDPKPEPDEDDEVDEEVRRCVCCSAITCEGAKWGPQECPEFEDYPAADRRNMLEEWEIQNMGDEDEN